MGHGRRGRGLTRGGQAPPSRSSRHFLFGIAATIWTVGTIAALWLPPPETPRLDWPWIDKAVHFVLFGGAATLWTLARVALVPLCIGLVLGAALTEIGQGLLPWSRQPDVVDFAFDVAGAALGLLVVRGLATLAARRTRRAKPLARD